ncbi:hypothetical protein [Streptosporangium sp. NPDC006007]|uniref:hypothetical protein n=1 Tax=Streptosporangium sp. NPDC006007 TaxID=3154575 RepID=UPI0033BA5315
MSRVSKASDPSKTSGPLTFEDAVSGLLVRMSATAAGARTVLAVQVAGAAIFFGAGVLLRSVVGWALPVSVAVCVVAWVVLMGNTHRLLGPVDWATAYPYWRTARRRMPEAARDALAAVIGATLARYRRIIAIHPCLAPCPEGVEDGTCEHAGCLNAGVLRVNNRRVLVIGRRVAFLPVPTFEAVIRHEMRHCTGVMSAYTAAQAVMRPMGWIVAGAAPVSPVVAVAVYWCAAGAVAWVNELIADASSVRAMGLEANLAAIRLTRGRLAGVPLRRRVIAVAVAVVFPTHPPGLLRVAVAHVVAVLPGSRPRPAGSGPVVR